MNRVDPFTIASWRGKYFENPQDTLKSKRATPLFKLGTWSPQKVSLISDGPIILGQFFPRMKMAISSISYRVDGRKSQNNVNTLIQAEAGLTARINARQYFSRLSVITLLAKVKGLNRKSDKIPSYQNIKIDRNEELRSNTFLFRMIAFPKLNEINSLGNATNKFKFFSFPLSKFKYLKL